MISSGTLRRLRPLPRVLLFAETVSAGMGIAVGARPWLMADPPQPVALTGLAGSGLAPRRSRSMQSVSWSTSARAKADPARAQLLVSSLLAIPECRGRPGAHFRASQPSS